MLTWLRGPMKLQTWSRSDRLDVNFAQMLHKYRWFDSDLSVTLRSAMQDCHSGGLPCLRGIAYGKWIREAIVVPRANESILTTGHTHH